jgi:hypothetical protein
MGMEWDGEPPRVFIIIISVMITIQIYLGILDIMDGLDTFRLSLES